MYTTKDKTKKYCEYPSTFLRYNSIQINVLN